MAACHSARAPFVAAFLERGSADVYEIEPTSIEVPCFFWGVASKSQAVPYRLDDTIRLMTLSECH